MSSIEIGEFSQSIKNFVAASPLPAEVKRLALAEILREQERAAAEQIRLEAIEREEEEEK